MDQHAKAWGIASLVVGILGLILFLAPYIGIIFSILAIIFSRIQKRKIGDTGVSTSGFITGIVGTVLNSIMLLIVIAVLIFTI